MSPTRQPYRASDDVCRFFERFRAAIATGLSPELREFHRPNEAEIRSGGLAAYKRHLHHSRFNDLKSGFYYVLWPDDLGLGGEAAALGLYVSFEPFKKGVHRVLRPRLRKGELGEAVAELGFDASPNLPLNSRDRTTGIWLAKRVVALDCEDGDLAVDLGSRLGKLMAACHPVVRQVVETDFPNLLKGRSGSGLDKRPSRPKRKSPPPKKGANGVQRSSSALRSSIQAGLRSNAGPFTFDEPATRARIKRLDTYLRREVMDEGHFTCSSESACRDSVSKKKDCTFHAGQLSHVGTRYDAAIGGVPLRVVVVGMSYGTDHEFMSLGARREMVLGVAQPDRRLNPHMKGTALALQAAFGLPTTDLDIENEYLGQRTLDYHVFNAFALVNCLLCSARKDGKKDHGTAAMRTSCQRHLLETLRILEPSLVVVQGQPPRQVLEHLIRWDEPGTTGWLNLNGVRSLVCAFAHPAARGEQRWESPDSPYLREIVLPALAEVRRRLGIADSEYEKR